jgi:transposase InsO family protein
LLHPLPIPERYWQSISIDYITHLPACMDNRRTYENILIIVDRLSKKKKFIPIVDLRVDTLVRAFVEYVWRKEGYPEQIVSDQGAQFTSHFWKRLCQRIRTKPKLSTSFHPETNGKTKNANAWLKQYLRAYVNYKQDN